MSIMQIIVPGTDLEQVTVNLDTDQVTNLYLNQAKYTKEILEMTKKLADTERMSKHYSESKDKAEAELQQAHALLSALGVEEKTKEEEAYYRKPLSVTTRIAVYIAGLK